MLVLAKILAKKTNKTEDRISGKSALFLIETIVNCSPIMLIITGIIITLVGTHPTLKETMTNIHTMQFVLVFVILIISLYVINSEQT